MSLNHECDPILQLPSLMPKPLHFWPLETSFSFFGGKQAIWPHLMSQKSGRRLRRTVVAGAHREVLWQPGGVGLSPDSVCGREESRSWENVQRLTLHKGAHQLSWQLK